MDPRPPVPPFTKETARQKVQAAEDAWNTRDPERVAGAYTEAHRVAEPRRAPRGSRAGRRVPAPQVGPRAGVPAAQEPVGLRGQPHRRAVPVRVAGRRRAVVAVLRQRAVGVRRPRVHATPGGQHQRRPHRRVRAARPARRGRAGPPSDHGGPSCRGGWQAGPDGQGQAGRRARPILSGDRRVVPEQLQRAHDGPGRRVGRDQLGPPHGRRRAHRLGQDALGLPLGHRPDGERAGARGEARAVPGALRLADEGARRRRRAQPARPARRHRPRRDPARAGAARHQRQRPLGRHPGQRAPCLRAHAHRHPHHDARVALPHAHLVGARGAPGRRDGHRRRGPRRRRHQARRPPRPQPRAARRHPAEAGPARRALGDGAPRRGGRALPRRRPPGRDRAAGVDQAVGPRRRRARPRHGRAVRRGRRDLAGRARPLGPGRGPGAAGEHLAARRGAHRRPHRRAPLDHRLRQLAAPRRAAHLAPQRDLGGAARRAGGPPRPQPRRPLDASARPGHGAGGSAPGVRRPCSPAPTTAR